MGAADVVPGVSGGTIAFITGIYQQLLNSIKAFNLAFFRSLFSGHFREALAGIPWGFLLPLLLGIATSIFSLAQVVLYLLHTHPVAVWSFFLGLVLASVILLVRSIVRLSRPALLICALGAIFAWWLTGLTPMQTTSSLWSVFGSAFVAICAMILPGISGAFVLVLLGKYQYILQAVADFNLTVLSVFALGCICGLLSFARVLSASFRLFPNATMAALAGLMLGSLRAVWPWKSGTSLALPPVWDSSVLLALGCCLAGIAIPLLINTLAQYLQRRAWVKLVEPN